MELVIFILALIWACRLHACEVPSVMDLLEFWDVHLSVHVSLMYKVASYPRPSPSLQCCSQKKKGLVDCVM